jgi:hypothetical protein
MARHGVISAGASTPESLVGQAGDYAAFISNHSCYSTFASLSPV